MSDAATALSSKGTLTTVVHTSATYRRWTPEERRDIRDWYRAGYSAPTIAAHLGSTESAVKSIIKRLGASRRGFKPGVEPTLSKTDQVAELLAEGLALTDIADRMGITRAAAKQAFKRIKRALGEQAK